MKMFAFTLGVILVLFSLSKFFTGTTAYIIFIVLAMVITVGVLASWISIDLTRINEKHKPFKWTWNRVKIVLACMAWPITAPILGAEAFFESLSPKSKG